MMNMDMFRSQDLGQAMHLLRCCVSDGKLSEIQTFFLWELYRELRKEFRIRDRLLSSPDRLKHIKTMVELKKRGVLRGVLLQ